jgi:hypothetical protein
VGALGKQLHWTLTLLAASGLTAVGGKMGLHDAAGRESNLQLLRQHP